MHFLFHWGIIDFNYHNNVALLRPQTKGHVNCAWRCPRYIKCCENHHKYEIIFKSIIIQLTAIKLLFKLIWSSRFLLIYEVISLRLSIVQDTYVNTHTHTHISSNCSYDYKNGNKQYMLLNTFLNDLYLRTTKC